MKSAIFIGFGIALLLMILNFWVALKIGDYYGRGLVFKDRRVELAREFV
jgi:ATP-binding cassette subfamily C (CFTR/MRP) protein 10